MRAIYFVMPLEGGERQFKIIHGCRANSKKDKKECLDFYFFINFLLALLAHGATHSLILIFAL